MSLMSDRIKIGGAAAEIALIVGIVSQFETKLGDAVRRMKQESMFLDTSNEQGRTVANFIEGAEDYFNALYKVAHNTECDASAVLAALRRMEFLPAEVVETPAQAEAAKAVIAAGGVR